MRLSLQPRVTGPTERKKFWRDLNLARFEAPQMTLKCPRSLEENLVLSENRTKRGSGMQFLASPCRFAPFGCRPDLLTSKQAKRSGQPLRAVLVPSRLPAMVSPFTSSAEGLTTIHDGQDPCMLFSSAGFDATRRMAKCDQRREEEDPDSVEDSRCTGRNRPQPNTRLRRLDLPDFRQHSLNTDSTLHHRDSSYHHLLCSADHPSAVLTAPRDSSTSQHLGASHRQTNGPTKQAFSMTFKAVIFDIGGVVVGSPLFAINR